MDENKTIATTVDSYEPNLWNFIGQYKSKYTLKSLVDQIHNDRIAGRSPEYPAILITGEIGCGRRTLAKALHNAVGNLEFKEAALVIGTTENTDEFFEESIEFTTFYIPNLIKVAPVAAGQLVHVVRDKCLKKSFPGNEKETISLKNRLIVMSTDSSPNIHQEMLKHIGIRCDLGGYSLEQIFQILNQRVKFLNWDASDTTLRLITQNSKNNPGTAMKLLQHTYMIARAEDKDKINVSHAKKALVMSG